MKFDLSQYATVEERLEKFWHDHPDGAIITEMIHNDNGVVIFKAYAYFERGGEVVATGHAEEVKDASPVNRTSYIENGETSAIGRCLANCNYAMKKRPSREEMQKAQRRSETSNPTTVVNNVVVETGELIAPQQRKTLGQLTIDLKLNKKFKPYASKVLGREITDVGEITKSEATKLIAEMIREKAQREEGEE